MFVATSVLQISFAFSLLYFAKSKLECLVSLSWSAIGGRNWNPLSGRRSHRVGCRRQCLKVDGHELEFVPVSLSPPSTTTTMQETSQLAFKVSANDVLKPTQQASSTAAPMPSPVHDQLMSDVARPSLPTSLSDFALPTMGSLSAMASNPLASGSKDDSAPVLRRLRRSTLVSYLSESRLHASASPLSMSFPSAIEEGEGALSG